jgi:RNA polymerase sigma-70 factor (ECF subfamily)
MSRSEPDFDTFCRALGPRLVGSLVLYCGDRAVAEELAQEALARAFEHWERVGPMASPEAWTYRVAFNLARSTFRRRAVERRAERALRTEPRHSPVDSDADAAVAVRAAVAALAPRQRATIVARFYAGLNVAETAQALHCAEGTVKALTHQAIANLRAAGLVDVDEEVAVDGPLT